MPHRVASLFFIIRLWRLWSASQTYTPNENPFAPFCYLCCAAFFVSLLLDVDFPHVSTHPCKIPRRFAYTQTRGRMKSAENVRPVIELAICLVRFWIHICRQNVTPQTRQTTTSSHNNNYDEIQKATPERQTVETSTDQQKKLDATKAMCRLERKWGAGHEQQQHKQQQQRRRHPVTNKREKKKSPAAKAEIKLLRPGHDYSYFRRITFSQHKM